MAKDDNELYSDVKGYVEQEEYLNGKLVKKVREEIDTTEKWDTVNIKHSSDKKEIPEREIVGYVKFQNFLNGKLIEAGEKPIYKSDWQVESCCEDTSTLGIGMVNPMYIEVNELQDKDYEYSKIRKFLKKYMAEYASKKGLDVDELELEFINYGKTELVYVLTEPNGERVTILTKQPAVEFGKVKQEAQNLRELKKVDKRVVAPIDYYRLGDQELYVTPYINQARCVASDGSWGMYIPEPFYRFEGFTREQEQVVNSCMIAKLVSLYDFEKGQGIASCKLGGGDFMLPKGWEKETPTIQGTLKNLYLIAAREMLDCSFEDYLDIIRSEFSRRTITENQDELLLNLRGRVPMQLEDIESGIELGKKIIAKRTTENQAGYVEPDERTL